MPQAIQSHLIELFFQKEVDLIFATQVLWWQVTLDMIIENKDISTLFV